MMRSARECVRVLSVSFAPVAISAPAGWSNCRFKGPPGWRSLDGSVATARFTPSPQLKLSPAYVRSSASNQLIFLVVSDRLNARSSQPTSNMGADEESGGPAMSAHPTRRRLLLAGTFAATAAGLNGGIADRAFGHASSRRRRRATTAISRPSGRSRARSSSRARRSAPICASRHQGAADRADRLRAHARLPAAGAGAGRPVACRCRGCLRQFGFPPARPSVHRRAGPLSLPHRRAGVVSTGRTRHYHVKVQPPADAC